MREAPNGWIETARRLIGDTFTNNQEMIDLIDLCLH